MSPLAYTDGGSHECRVYGQEGAGVGHVVELLLVTDPPASNFSLGLDVNGLSHLGRGKKECEKSHLCQKWIIDTNC